MYSPKSFQVNDQTTALEFVDSNAFAIVTSNVNGEPVATHCPMHVMDKTNLSLFGHFARANPHCAALDGNTKMLCIFAGPHTYVSPTWYKSATAVPTWNYTTVHIAGTATVIEDPAVLNENLLELTAMHDAAPISQLTESLMPDKFMRGMIKGIVGFRLQITSIQMTCKLSQNRPYEDQLAVITQLENSTNSDAQAIAQAMKGNLK